VRLWPRRGADEVKSVDVIPEWIWDQLGAANLRGGGFVPMERAVGVPAVLAVIRLIAHAAALVPLHVIRADDDLVRGEPLVETRRREVVKK